MERIPFNAKGGSGVNGLVSASWPYFEKNELNDLWVRMHLINDNLGGRGVKENLIPGPKTVNTPMENFSEKPHKELVGIKTDLEESVIWMQTEVGYYPKSKGKDINNEQKLKPIYRFANAIRIIGGLHFYDGTSWKRDKRKILDRKFPIPLPSVTNTKDRAINFRTAKRVEILEINFDAAALNRANFKNNLEKRTNGKPIYDHIWKYKKHAKSVIDLKNRLKSAGIDVDKDAFFDIFEDLTELKNSKLITFK